MCGLGPVLNGITQFSSINARYSTSVALISLYSVNLTELIYHTEFLFDRLFCIPNWYESDEWQQVNFVQIKELEVCILDAKVKNIY